MANLGFGVSSWIGLYHLFDQEFIQCLGIQGLLHICIVFLHCYGQAWQRFQCVKILLYHALSLFFMILPQK